MRILIVGAGIAGLTLVGLLSRQGQSPVVIDRRAEGADAGYGLAVWPHGGRVLHGLGVHNEFVARSEPMRTYVARDRLGHELTSSPIPASISAYGHLGIIPRSDLVGLLHSTLDGVETRQGITVEALAQSADRVDELSRTDATYCPMRWSSMSGADAGGSRRHRPSRVAWPG